MRIEEVREVLAEGEAPGAVVVAKCTRNSGTTTVLASVANLERLDFWLYQLAAQVAAQEQVELEYRVEMPNDRGYSRRFVLFLNGKADKAAIAAKAQSLVRTAEIFKAEKPLLFLTLVAIARERMASTDFVATP